MQYANSLLDLIGNTPLVRLSRTLDLPDGGADAPLVLAKVEYLNPGGSVKDRIATRMIEAAEASGELQPGGTIVEPTSGNTGVGLAMVAQQKGYKCVFVCPDKVSEDKRNVLKAYGAEVVVCPTAVAPEHPDSYYNVSDRLSKEPGAWKPDQYSNPHNPRSHYETTGPEIWAQTEGKITHFVTGMGTGGTISGVGRYLKEQNPWTSRSSAPTRPARSTPAAPAAPTSSRASARTSGPRPTTAPSPTASSRSPTPTPSPSPAASRARRRCWSAAPPAWRPTPPASSPTSSPAEGRTDAVIVVLLPDSGRGYLTKVFNDEWLGQYGFATGAQADHRTVGEVLRGKSGQLPDLVHTHPGETIAEAVHILQEYGVSQMPVVRAEPPIVAAEVAGSVSERTLLDALFAGNAKLTDQVEDHMSEALPTIGSTEAAADAVVAARARRRGAGPGGRQAHRRADPAGPAHLRGRLVRRPTARLATGLVALACLGALGACSSDDAASTSKDPVEVEVGKAFTWNGFDVEDGWELNGIKRSAGLEEVTTPEVKGTITNTSDEERAALFEMVFSTDGSAGRDAQLLGRDHGRRPVPAVHLPGPQHDDA